MGFLRRKRHPLELETERLANVVQHQLTRLNLAYRQKIDGVVHTQQVEFVQPLIAYPTELKLEIDVQRLPRGVHITDLRDAKLLETLSVACKHPVRAEHKRGAGFWYVIERDIRAKIPANVRMSDMLVDPKAHPLTVPFGVGEHGKKRFENIRDLPHLLIAGATGRGKSVFVNALVGTLLHRLSPDMLKLVLVDLKGGMELGIYEDLLHISGYIDVNTRFPQLLIHLQTEMERRAGLMKKQARDVDEYNAMVDRADRLPYIVLVVDEIANAMLLKQRITLTRADGSTYKDTVKAATEALLADLAARARATGIHLIISTQRPSVDVITGLIKANFPCRVAFGTASEIDSRVIIDDAGAYGLPVGRCLFRREMELLELQAPYMSTAQVKKLIRAIENGENSPLTPPPSQAEIDREHCGLLLSLGLSQFAGRLPVVRLVEERAVKAAGISHHRIDLLLSKLASEKIIGRGWRRGVYRIKVSLEHWQKMYPVPTQKDGAVKSNPPHHRPATALVPDDGDGQNQPSGTSTPTQRIKQLHAAGYSRNQIAHQLGGRRQTTLAFIREVLATPD